MASHGCPPGLALQQELGMVSSIMKGCQPLLPSPVPKPEIIRCQSPNLSIIPSEESRMTQNEWFNSNQFVNVDLSALRPMPIDVQGPSTVLFSFGIVEQCTEHDKNLQFITAETAEAGTGGVHIALSSDLMDLQLSGIVEPQQPLPSLIYPNSGFYISKPLLDIFQDSAISSKFAVHQDGQLTFMGTAIEMKDILSVVAEWYLAENAHKGGKQSMLVPNFIRLDINEVVARSHSSTLDTHSSLTVPLRSPEKAKVKQPSQRKNKKLARERDLYKKNYLHACESLLSLMVDKRKHRKTAILSLKKSGPELPELLTQCSAGIAGTGLAVLLSVICKLACGTVPFCASKLLNTGFGFGLVWLSWAVNKLRDTIVNTSKNAGKIGLKDEEMIQKVDKSLREVYFRAAALLAVAVLRLA
ncbi:hypothetical protein SESBI_26392 [Sesbania bispinosa]|nr:hypothetical protein SESBI_26392 [Sesbania bispinosa]